MQRTDLGNITDRASGQAALSRRRFHFTWGTAALFLLPAVLLYVIFVFYPILNALFLSFFRWDGVSVERNFVGFDNYVRIFTQDPVFWRALSNSAIWVVLSLIVPTGVGLLLALALNQRLWGRSVFRTMFYLPAVIASIAVAAIWGWMYNPSVGVINAVLHSIGLGGLVQDWLGNRDIALYSVFIASVWAATGTNMILFLAGLQAISQDLIEAARVDGANHFQVFRNITIPGLRPTFIIVFSLSIINSLKAFDLIYGMTYGGPGDASQVLALWGYFQGFQYRNFGVGMAIVMVLFAITLAIVVPYVRFASNED
jgi:raffinose/stachyose/melibiose transport system permease protein